MSKTAVGSLWLHVYIFVRKPYSVSHEHEEMIGQHVVFHQHQLRLDSGPPAS